MVVCGSVREGDDGKMKKGKTDNAIDYPCCLLRTIKVSVSMSVDCGAWNGKIVYGRQTPERRRSTPYCVVKISDIVIRV